MHHPLCTLHSSHARSRNARPLECRKVNRKLISSLARTLSTRVAELFEKVIYRARGKKGVCVL